VSEPPKETAVAARPPRVLAISHAATVSGAPRSLRDLLAFARDTAGWEIRVLVRKNGPAEDLYGQIGISDVFYRFQSPEKALPVRSIRRELLDVADGLRHGRLRAREAYRSLRQHRRARRAARRQRAWEDRLCAEVAAWKPDVIYSNTAVNGDVIKRLDLPDVPVVVHVRELATAMRTLSQAQVDEFRTRPSVYLAVSESVRAYLRREHGVPDEKLHVVPVGLDIDAIRARAIAEETPAIRASLLPEPDAGVLVCGVGFLNSRKGPDLFFEVAEAILRGGGDDPPVRFVWLGEGDMLEPLRDRARGQGFENAIVFPGVVENPYPYLRACDFVLMTSRDDPFPRVNLEAAVFGRPIVCFEASGGSKEFAADSCGVVVPGLDLDAMIAETRVLIRDRARREALGGASASARFGWRRCVKRC